MHGADKIRMSLFEWRPEYSLGHDGIDAQHKRLFELGNELHNAMTQGKGKGALSETLGRLLDYTKTHFANEERLMETHHYPDYVAHKAAHDALTSRVIQFQQDFAAGRVGITVELLQFLRDWLRTHIGETDRKVATFLKAKAA
jgi:hemerythrin